MLALRFVEVLVVTGAVPLGVSGSLHAHGKGSNQTSNSDDGERMFKIDSDCSELQARKAEGLSLRRPDMESGFLQGVRFAGRRVTLRAQTPHKPTCRS